MQIYGKYIQNKSEKRVSFCVWYTIVVCIVLEEKRNEFV